jgi:hypothetical protein
LTAAGSSWRKRGSKRADRVDDLDGVGARLALDRQDHRALVVVPAGDLVGLHAVDDAPELLEPHRRAVAIGHDQRPESLGVLQLAGRHDVEHLVLAVERAGREVHVAAVEACCTSSMPMPRVVSARGSSCTRTGVLLRAEDLHLRDAGDVEMRWARFVCAYSSNGVERQGRGAQRQVEAPAGRPGSPSGRSAASACRAARAAPTWRSSPARPARRRRCCRSRLNWIVICVRPSALDEVIESMPAIVVKFFSSGVATAEAIVSGLAPGSEAATWIVGKVDVGQVAHGQEPEAHHAE